MRSEIANSLQNTNKRSPGCQSLFGLHVKRIPLLRFSARISTAIGIMLVLMAPLRLPPAGAAGNGAVWAPTFNTVTGDLAGISCPSTSTCYAPYNDGIARSSDAGLTWSSVFINQFRVYAVGCVGSVTNCWALASDGQHDDVLQTTDGWDHWVWHWLPAGVASLDAMSCGIVNCVAIGTDLSGNSIADFFNSAIPWGASQPTPLPTNSPTVTYVFDTIDCVNTHNCYVGGSERGLGEDAVVLYSSDAFQTWSIHQVPSAGSPLLGRDIADIACTSNTDCYAVGGAMGLPGEGTAILDYTNNFGQSWSARSVPTSSVYFDGISCSSTTNCYAVGNDNNTPGNAVIVGTSDGGITWTSEDVPEDTPYLSGIMCPSATCFATTYTPGLILSNGTGTAELGGMTPLTPTRIMDTRTNNGATGPVGTGTTVPLQVDGLGGVPSSGVAAVVLNVTVTAPTAAGYLTVWADGATMPTTSNLDFSKGETIPNLVIVPVGADGKVDFFNSSGNVQVVADVTGWIA
jgi:hypothetical protein